jgi:hypothetical protein
VYILLSRRQPDEFKSILRLQKGFYGFALACIPDDLFSDETIKLAIINHYKM